MKYKTIVIDPPWRLETGPKPVNGKVFEQLPYGTMTDEEIAEFPIDDFADKDCALFIWAVHSRLHVALNMLEFWGFKYYCVFTWVKNSGLTIQGVCKNSEFVVYGYRGKFPIPFKGSAIHTAFHGKSGKHSEKPDKFYEMVRAKLPAPRIDIFARKRHYGFDAWGNQVEPEANTLEAYNDKTR